MHDKPLNKRTKSSHGQGSVAMDPSDCRIVLDESLSRISLSRISCNGPIRLLDFTQPHCTLHKIDESLSRISLSRISCNGPISTALQWGISKCIQYCKTWCFQAIIQFATLHIPMPWTWSWMSCSQGGHFLQTNACSFQVVHKLSLSLEYWPPKP